MAENRTENSCIDLLKITASLMIFALHCQAFSDLGHFSFIWELLSRWGVPYFFLASSYFLFSKHNNCNDASTVKNYVFRIATLYFAWFLFNIPNIYLNRLYENDLASIKTWLIFIKTSILSSTFTGSWYLVSCAFCAFAVYFLCRFFNTRTVICISLFIQIICVCSSVWCVFPTTVQKVFEFLCFPLNIFGGMLYFSIGKWIAENKESLLKKNKNMYILTLCCAYILYVLEIFISRKYEFFDSSDEAFSLIPISICLFIIALQSKIKLKNAKNLRKISTIVYCGQGNVLIFSSVLKRLFHMDSSLLRFALSSIAMAVIVLIILTLQKQRKPKWIRYFT